MSSMLREMLAHEAWADAEHWRTIQGHAAAREDPILRARLHHLHLVQQSFLWTVGDRSAPFTLTTPDDFPTFESLKEYARGVQHDSEQQLTRLTDGQLAERVGIPWFTDPPLTLSRTEALTQRVMHSQWHRGQNSTRLRDLGINPPMLDLIVWLWRGKPLATWET